MTQIILKINLKKNCNKWWIDMPFEYACNKDYVFGRKILGASSIYIDAYFIVLMII